MLLSKPALNINQYNTEIKQLKQVPGNRPLAKMAAILIFFYLHLNQPYQPRPCVKLSKEYFTPNEASKANLNVDKRILKSPPFLQEVYEIKFLIMNSFIHLQQQLLSCFDCNVTIIYISTIFKNNIVHLSYRRYLNPYIK